MDFYETKGNNITNNKVCNKQLLFLRQSDTSLRSLHHWEPLKAICNLDIFTVSLSLFELITNETVKQDSITTYSTFMPTLLTGEFKSSGKEAMSSLTLSALKWHFGHINCASLYGTLAVTKCQYLVARYENRMGKMCNCYSFDGRMSWLRHNVKYKKMMM